MIAAPYPTDLTLPGNLESWWRWCRDSYPYDPRTNRWLRTRMPESRPAVGSDEELEDLRGILDYSIDGRPDYTKTQLATQWFWAREHVQEIEREQRRDREKQRAENRAAVVRCAHSTLHGSPKDPCTLLAQKTFGTCPPENCENYILSDWFLEHRWTRRKMREPNAPRPKLSIDRERDRQRKFELDDIHGAIAP